MKILNLKSHNGSIYVVNYMTVVTKFSDHTEVNLVLIVNSISCSQKFIQRFDLNNPNIIKLKFP